MDHCPNTEEITIKLKLQQQQIYISNIYNPPKTKLNEDDYQLMAARPNLILLGDLNAHHPMLMKGDETNTEGLALEKLIEDNDLVLKNDGTGTFLKKDGTRSALDVTLASCSVSMKLSWTVIEDCMGSDHLPILISLNEPAEREDITASKYLYKRADWTSFREASKQSFSKQLYDDNNSTYNNNIVKAIHDAAEKSIPKTRPNNRTKCVPYWNKECSDAVKKRNKAQHRMKRTKDLADCIEFRKSKAEAQKTIRLEQRRHWEEYCGSLTSDKNLTSVWRMAKNMAGTQDNSAIPTLSANNRLYETARDKASLIAETLAATSADSNYSSSFKQHRKQMEENWTKTPADSADSVDEMESLNQPFELHELQTAIKLCKNGSSPGYDDVTYELIKHLPKAPLQQLLVFYNKLWKEGLIVAEWKNSIVIPIYKSGSDKSQPSSYRPISLTPALCKINERLITTRLYWYFESKKNCSIQTSQLSGNNGAH